MSTLLIKTNISLPSSRSRGCKPNVGGGKIYLCLRKLVNIKFILYNEFSFHEFSNL